MQSSRPTRGLLAPHPWQHAQGARMGVVPPAWAVIERELELRA